MSTTTFRWVTAADETVLLDGSQGVKLTRPATGLDVPPVELQVEQRISASGGVVFHHRMSPRPFTLSLLIDETVVSMRDVARRFAFPSTTGGTLVATTDGTERSLETVIYESGLEGEYSASAGGGAFGWRITSLNMVAMDPWWYGPYLATALNFGAVTTFNDPAVDFDDPLTPFNGGDATQVPVAGDVEADTLFVVTGPFDALQLEGLSTGETVELTGTVATGDTLTINSAVGERGPRLNSGAIDWSLITPASRLFRLPYPAGTVTVSATGSDADSGLLLHWRNRYLTP